LRAQTILVYKKLCAHADKIFICLWSIIELIAIIANFSCMLFLVAGTHSTAESLSGFENSKFKLAYAMNSVCCTQNVIATFYNILYRKYIIY